MLNLQIKLIFILIVSTTVAYFLEKSGFVSLVMLGLIFYGSITLVMLFSFKSSIDNKSFKPLLLPIIVVIAFVYRDQVAKPKIQAHAGNTLKSIEAKFEERHAAVLRTSATSGSDLNN